MTHMKDEDILKALLEEEDDFELESGGSEPGQNLRPKGPIPKEDVQVAPGTKIVKLNILVKNVMCQYVWSTLIFFVKTVVAWTTMISIKIYLHCVQFILNYKEIYSSLLIKHDSNN